MVLIYIKITNILSDQIFVLICTYKFDVVADMLLQEI
jgi:hypothetical protein